MAILAEESQLGGASQSERPHDLPPPLCRCDLVLRSGDARTLRRYVYHLRVISNTPTGIRP
eukprot:COSAG01_NODE_6614_length_3581_cov_1.071018_6_plen_61_part_00